MTDEQMQAEYAYYLWQAGSSGDLDVAMSCYPDDEARAKQCAAEMAYYHAMGRLPAWGTVIERVECHPDGDLYIHTDGRTN